MKYTNKPFIGGIISEFNWKDIIQIGPKDGDSFKLNREINTL